MKLEPGSTPIKGFTILIGIQIEGGPLQGKLMSCQIAFKLKDICTWAANFASYGRRANAVFKTNNAAPASWGVLTNYKLASHVVQCVFADEGCRVAKCLRSSGYTCAKKVGANLHFYGGRIWSPCFHSVKDLTLCKFNWRGAELRCNFQPLWFSSRESPGFKWQLTVCNHFLPGRWSLNFEIKRA